MTIEAIRNQTRDLEKTPDTDGLDENPSPSSGSEQVPDPERDPAPSGCSGEGTTYEDPRPDFHDQDETKCLWQLFLVRAANKDETLACTLHGMRIYGLRLEENPDHPGMRLDPTDYKDDWQADRKNYLLEYREELTEVLRSLEERCSAELEEILMIDSWTIHHEEDSAHEEVDKDYPTLEEYFG